MEGHAPEGVREADEDVVHVGEAAAHGDRLQQRHKRIHGPPRKVDAWENDGRQDEPQEEGDAGDLNTLAAVVLSCVRERPRGDEAREREEYLCHTRTHEPGTSLYLRK